MNRKKVPDRLVSDDFRFDGQTISEMGYNIYQFGDYVRIVPNDSNSNWDSRNEMGTVCRIMAQFDYIMVHANSNRMVFSPETVALF
jgi:hypothetical protein